MNERQQHYAALLPYVEQLRDMIDSLESEGENFRAVDQLPIEQFCNELEKLTNQFDGWINLHIKEEDR